MVRIEAENEFKSLPLDLIEAIFEGENVLVQITAYDPTTKNASHGVVLYRDYFDRGMVTTLLGLWREEGKIVETFGTPDYMLIGPVPNSRVKVF